MARAIRGDDAAVAEGPAGQVVDSSLLAHTDRLRRELYPLGENAWTLVGTGVIALGIAMVVRRSAG